MGKQVPLSWLARLALSELADRRCQDEQKVLEELITQAAIAELGHNRAEALYQEAGSTAGHGHE